ncbi:MAG: hypothetical protein HeimC2_28660 [Candidatus Heimdallarchaeota archaeon LC_2]|nr:MAG: hypothetical protein HeimC2_28660 [Candidatus Heimdallarchaeota archaeon LC_2]
MDKQIEFKELIDNIPKFLEYGSHAQLQISLPTTSHITLGETINIIQNQAREMGWPVENISVIKVGGYIICEECKKQAHIHISTPEKKYCMNCGHDGKRTATQAKVRVIE